MKKLLILGGGHSEIPLVKSAKKLGFYVITTGNRRDDLGHKYSDEYVNGDFSDKKEMLELVEKLNVDAISPCANDFSALSCSYIADRLGFTEYDSYEISKIIHHKDLFREFSQKNNLSSPRSKSFRNIEDVISQLKDFNFPIIIKPVDLSGGKGVTKIKQMDFNKVNEAVKKALDLSKEKRVVIEEFIEGTNHGFSTFLRDGKIVFYFCDNEHYFKNKFMVSGASAPGDVPQSAIEKLIDESQKMASILNLKDGIFHIQFILKNDIPYIIEVCRRPPGDLYIDFVKYATGVDYPEYIIRSFSGMGINDLARQNPKEYITRHCVMGDKNGIIKNIIFDNSIKNNIIDKFMWWEEGDKIIDFMTYKAGIVFLKFDSKKEADEKIEKLNELIRIVVE